MKKSDFTLYIVLKYLLLFQILGSIPVLYVVGVVSLSIHLELGVEILFIGLFGAFPIIGVIYFLLIRKMIRNSRKGDHNYENYKDNPEKVRKLKMSVNILTTLFLCIVIILMIIAFSL